MWNQCSDADWCQREGFGDEMSLYHIRFFEHFANGREKETLYLYCPRLRMTIMDYQSEKPVTSDSILMATRMERAINDPDSFIGDDGNGYHVKEVDFLELYSTDIDFLRFYRSIWQKNPES